MRNLYLNACWWLSYHLGIGQCFKGDEECELCGCPASEDDFWVERIGKRRVRCRDRDACLSAHAPDQSPQRELLHGDEQQRRQASMPEVQSQERTRGLPRRHLLRRLLPVGRLSLRAFARTALGHVSATHDCHSSRVQGSPVPVPVVREQTDE